MTIKGADQPERLHNVTKVFVASVIGLSYPVVNPEDRFFHFMAHLMEVQIGYGLQKFLWRKVADILQF